MYTHNAVSAKQTIFLSTSHFQKLSKIKRGLILCIRYEANMTMKGCSELIHFTKVTGATVMANIIDITPQIARKDCNKRFET